MPCTADTFTLLLPVRLSQRMGTRCTGTRRLCSIVLELLVCTYITKPGTRTPCAMCRGGDVNGNYKYGAPPPPPGMKSRPASTYALPAPNGSTNGGSKHSKSGVPESTGLEMVAVKVGGGAQWLRACLAAAVPYLLLDAVTQSWRVKPYSRLAVASA